MTVFAAVDAYHHLSGAEFNDFSRVMTDATRQCLAGIVCVPFLPTWFSADLAHLLCVPHHAPARNLRSGGRTQEMSNQAIDERL